MNGHEAAVVATLEMLDLVNADDVYANAGQPKTAVRVPVRLDGRVAVTLDPRTRSPVTIQLEAVMSVLMVRIPGLLDTAEALGIPFELAEQVQRARSHGLRASDALQLLKPFVDTVPIAKAS